MRQARFDDPSVRTRTLVETFARLVAIGELLLLLREAGRLELGTESETERTRLQSGLESLTHSSGSRASTLNDMRERFASSCEDWRA